MAMRTDAGYTYDDSQFTYAGPGGGGVNPPEGGSAVPPEAQPSALDMGGAPHSKVAQLSNASDLLGILNVLRQLRNTQTRPEDVGYRNWSRPEGLSMMPPELIQRGNTTFGGIPYARNKWAVALNSMASTMTNLAEVQRVNEERKRAAEREMKLDKAIEAILGHVNATYGTPDQQDSPVPPPLPTEGEPYQVGGEKVPTEEEIKAGTFGVNLR